MIEICQCPKCGTEHIVHPNMLVQPVHIMDKSEVPKLSDAIAKQYALEKAIYTGDTTKCIEPVPSGKDTTKEDEPLLFKQCSKPKAKGSKYRKQHRKQHPEGKMVI